MVAVLHFCLLFTLLAAPGAGQRFYVGEDPKLPNGKSQRDEILKVEHAKNLEDSAKLKELARDLEAQLEKSGFAVLSRDALKQTEEIEKLAKRIRSRLKR